MNERKWIKPWHGAVRNVVFAVFAPYTALKYGVKVEKFSAQGERPYLVLYNHQTPFDQFFVGMAFKGAVYYLATEDIFSLGAVSSVLKALVAPIPIKKQTTDIAAVRACIRVAREGGTIALAPEGNRTYSGKTEYINPAIAALAKKLKLPIAIFRIEGGYGVQPRWSDKVRRGHMRAYVSRVIEPEEYSKLTNDELYSLIVSSLAVNDGAPGGRYRSKRRAEYLERAIYVCPYCGLSSFESRGNTTRCTKCGREISYGEDKKLTGAGVAFPFGYVNDWYEYQCDYVRALDLSQYTAAPAFRDTVRLYEVIVYKTKHCLMKNASLALYGDRVVINEGEETELNIPFSEASAFACLGRNKLNIYFGDKVYQIKGNKRFNALKYVNFFYLNKNKVKGDNNGKFLGL